MSDEIFEIHNNYSIGEVLEKYRGGNRSKELAFLAEKIEAYREASNKRIWGYLNCIRDFSKPDAMRWISSNVEEEFAPYVRMAYLGRFKEDDVLKCNPNRYKSISKIGIEVLEADPESKKESWLKEWKEQAGKIGNIKIFESHGHYNLAEFKNCYPELLELMHKGGHIDTIINPSVEYSTIAQMKSMFDAPQYSYILYAFGSHPKYLWKEAGLWTSERWNRYLNLIKSDPKCVAVGEAGLDYSYPEFNADHQAMQKDFFIKFIEAANEAGLPVILHIRPSDYKYTYSCDTALQAGSSLLPAFDAHIDALEIIREHPIKYGAVAHCFGGDYATFKAYEAAGVRYFGIGGRITYGEQGLTEAVRNMSEEALLIETDAPFIRVNGDTKPNTSLSLYDIAAKIAEIRNSSIEHVIEVSYINGMNLFRLKN